MTDKFEKTYAKTIFDYVLKHRCRNVSLPFNKIDGVEVYGYITAPTRVEAYRIYIYIYVASAGLIRPGVRLDKAIFKYKKVCGSNSFVLVEALDGNITSVPGCALHGCCYKSVM